MLQADQLQKELLEKSKQLIDYYRKVRESEEKFKTFTDHSTEGITLADLEGNYVYVNASFRKLTAFSEEELLDMSMYDILSDQKKTAQILKDLKPDQNYVYWTSLVCKDKSICQVEISTKIIRLGEKEFIFEAIRDIRRQLAREKELQRLNTAVEQSANIVVITDLKGDIEYINPRFTQITGYSREEVIGKNPRILKAGTQAPEFYSELWKTITRGKIWKGEFHNKTKSGNLYWEMATITPIRDANNKIINYLGVKEDITKRKKAEQELKENKEFLTLLINSSPDVIIYKDEEGKWLLANQTAIKLFELENINYFGLKDIEIVQEGDFYYETLKNCVETDQLAWKAGKMTRIIENVAQKNNRTLNFDVYKIPLYHDDNSKKGILIIGRDITEQKQIETINKIQFLHAKSLNRITHTLVNENNPKNILEETINIISETINADRALIFRVDTKKKLMIGLSECLKPGIQATNGTYDTSEHFGSIKWMMENKKCIVSDDNNINPVLVSDGSDQLLHGSLKVKSILFLPFHFAKDSFHLIAINQIRNYRKWTKDEISFLNTVSSHVSIALQKIKHLEELKKRKNEVEKHNQQKTKFLANISHEIRTPLNAITGFSNIIKSKSPNKEETAEYIDIILNNSNHLLHLINDLIDISRIESGQMKIEKTEINFPALVHKVAGSYRTLLKNNVEIIIKNELPQWAERMISDEVRLQQILRNLIGNAVKFTSEGFIEIGFTLDQNNKVKVYVKDTGIGIHNKELKHIFERYRQANNNNHSYEGTGLGLAICKACSTLLGGNITAQSEINKGSVFTFTFSFVKAQIQQKKSDKPREKYDITIFKDKSILIVEDESCNAKLLSILLKPTQAKISVAKDGIKAVEICRDNPDIDLVLMDMQLPRLDGLKASKKILKFRPDLPIVCQTANVMDEDIRESKKVGCVDHILKPIIEDRLFEILYKYL